MHYAHYVACISVGFNADEAKYMYASSVVLIIFMVPIGHLF